MPVAGGSTAHLRFLKTGGARGAEHWCWGEGRERKADALRATRTPGGTTRFQYWNKFIFSDFDI